MWYSTRSVKYTWRRLRAASVEKNLRNCIIISQDIHQTKGYKRRYQNPQYIRTLQHLLQQPIIMSLGYIITGLSTIHWRLSAINHKPVWPDLYSFYMIIFNIICFCENSKNVALCMHTRPTSHLSELLHRSAWGVSVFCLIITLNFLGDFVLP